MPAPRAVLDVQGLPQIREKLDPQRLREALRATAQDAFAPVVEEARAAAPVRTGKMAESIRTEVRNKGEDFEVVIGTGVPYGHLVERGHATATGMVPPRPFVEPAFRANEGLLIEAIEHNLRLVLGWT